MANFDDQKLNRLYQETIQEHQSYLDRLQAAFEKRCDEIRAEAQAKIDATGPNDKEARKKILKEEQQLLDKTLAELRYAVNKSDNESRKKLEEIEEKREQEEFNLNQALSNL